MRKSNDNTSAWPRPKMSHIIRDLKSEKPQNTVVALTHETPPSNDTKPIAFSMITPCPKCHKRHGRDSSPGLSIESTAATTGRSRSTFVLILGCSLLTAGAGGASSVPPKAVTPINQMRHFDTRLATGGIYEPDEVGLLVDVAKGRAGRRIEADNHENDHQHGLEGVEGQDESHDRHEEEHEGHEEERHDEEGQDHEEDAHHDHDEHDGGEHEDHHDHPDEVTFRYEADTKPWGPVIAATLLVNLATLGGLLLLVVPTVRKGLMVPAGHGQSHGKVIDILIPGFAVGALLATAVFLVLPEALHLIEGGHGEHEDHRLLQEQEGHDEHEGHQDNNSEGVAFAKWGCGILGGFLLPIFMSIFFRKHIDEDEGSAGHSEEECASCIEKEGDVPTAVAIHQIEDGVYDADEDLVLREAAKESVPEKLNQEIQEAPIEPALATKTKVFINYRLVATVLIGDIFCNFADGLFIGAAFLGCSWATAISITAIALFHEIPQEIADFVILTRYAGLSVVQACVSNFVTGLSVCLGGLVVFVAKPSDEATGVILAFAAGAYIHIAACESIPRIERAKVDRMDDALTLFSIVLGTIPIGLILLNHKHC